jgi:hypothetical protein
MVSSRQIQNSTCDQRLEARELKGKKLATVLHQETTLRSNTDPDAVAEEDAERRQQDGQQDLQERLRPHRCCACGAEAEQDQVPRSAELTAKGRGTLSENGAKLPAGRRRGSAELHGRDTWARLLDTCPSAKRPCLHAHSSCF